MTYGQICEQHLKLYTGKKNSFWNSNGHNFMCYESFVNLLFECYKYHKMTFV